MRNTGLLVLMFLLAVILWLVPRSNHEQLTNQQFQEALEGSGIEQIVIEQNQQPPTGAVWLRIDGEEYVTYVADVQEAQTEPVR